MPREWPRPGPTRWSYRSWGWRRATATGRGAPSRRRQSSLPRRQPCRHTAGPRLRPLLARRNCPSVHEDRRPGRTREAGLEVQQYWLQVQRPPPRRRARRMRRQGATPPAARFLAGDEPTGTEERHRRHPRSPRGAWPSRRSRRATSPATEPRPRPAILIGQHGLTPRTPPSATSAHPPPSGYHAVRRTAAGAGDDHLERPRRRPKATGMLSSSASRTSSVRSTSWASQRYELRFDLQWLFRPVGCPSRLRVARNPSTRMFLPNARYPPGTGGTGGRWGC